MARITGISTPVGGVSWEYTDDDSSSVIMYIAVLLESKCLLTMPWSRVNCNLPFELDVEYCTRSASELKAVIPFILSSHKVSPSVLLAIHEVIHALNDFLNDVAPVRDPPVMIDKSAAEISKHSKTTERKNCPYNGAAFKRRGSARVIL